MRLYSTYEEKYPNVLDLIESKKICKSCDIILGLHKTSEPYREMEYVKNQNSIVKV